MTAPYVANDNARPAPAAPRVIPPPAASGILPGLKAWHVALGMLCIPIVVLASAVYAVVLAWHTWRQRRAAS